MAINPLPTPPAPTDSPQDFNTKAFDLLNALPDFVTEANAQAVQVDTDAGTATSAASTATGAASTATTKASEASDSADAAALSATEAAGLVENYQGALGSDPTLNKDGDPLQAGDWYVNTATGLIRAYNGTQWVTSLNVTAGVESFSAGSTGLTPSTGTTGDVTLAGTLAVANGGTGATSLTGLIVGDGTNPLTAVTTGADGQFLKLTGSPLEPVWDDVPTSRIPEFTFYTASNTYTVPDGVTSIRAYAFGRGGDGAAEAGGGGGGGGCAFGDIAVTPGSSVTVDITSGVATVAYAAVTMLTANAGVTSTGNPGGAGGTASKDASVTSGGNFTGGTGGAGGGGGSSGSPLGNGFNGGGSASSGGGGWGGAGASTSDGGGGGAGGGGAASASGGSGGAAINSPFLRGGISRSINSLFSDLLMRHATAPGVTAGRFFSAAAGNSAGPGAGGSGGDGACGGHGGDFGGGGGSAANNAIAGNGGFGGGGGAASASGGVGGSSVIGGGGGGGGLSGTAGTGGPACVVIYA